MARIRWKRRKIIPEECAQVVDVAKTKVVERKRIERDAWESENIEEIKEQQTAWDRKAGEASKAESEVKKCFLELKEKQKRAMLGRR